MQIQGLMKTTLLDFPGHVAATLFTGGCNFRCPFCHNSDLVVAAESQPILPTAEILAFLNKRRGILEGVCISGGEPTLQKDLKSFILSVRDMGYLVKLDTNGSNSSLLEELLTENLLDYVAMDIKNSKENYASTCGFTSLDLNEIEQSVSLLMNSSIPYEFRTTVVRELHETKDFQAIGQWLSGAKAYYLQCYKDSDHIIKPGYTAYRKEELEDFQKLLTPYFKLVELRGID